MIISRDINPNNQLYTAGSLIISVLDNWETGEMDIMYLFEEVEKDYDISFTVFSLGLDWLFLIGAVDYKNGKMIKCF